jgi:hypothetical protein
MWIKLKDQEPADGAEVLVSEPPTEEITLCWIGEFSSELAGFEIVGGGFLESGDVSYWMEIPPTPKEDAT